MEPLHVASLDTEADLCTLFMRQFGALEGWTCYPEAGGFDVLAVHDDGRQIGVEAKLTLNAKVAEQILPHKCDEFYEKPGPDHRMVIVAKLAKSSVGIARMLEMLGVAVLVAYQHRSLQGDSFSLPLHNILEARGRETMFGSLYLHDWNPPVRCHVPAVVQALPAGVPSPVKITPWKEKAVQIVALMRRQGYVTAKQIAAHGHAATRWTQPNDGKPAWLAKGPTRGLWIETKDMPAFDQQHPELYALAVAEAEAKAEPSLF